MVKTVVLARSRSAPAGINTNLAQRLKRLSKYEVRTVRSTVQRDWFYELPQHIGDDAGLTDGFFDGGPPFSSRL